jgi:hypothetical protein
MRDVMENNTRPLSELWKGIDAWDIVLVTVYSKLGQTDITAKKIKQILKKIGMWDPLQVSHGEAHGLRWKYRIQLI